MLSSQGYVHILKHRYYTCVKHTQIISYMQVNTDIHVYVYIVSPVRRGTVFGHRKYAKYTTMNNLLMKLGVGADFNIAQP